MKKLFITAFAVYTFSLAYTQNVGIGTNAPSEKLHVAGNIKADTLKPNALKLLSNAGVGKILTSDGTGNANWQTNNATAAGNSGFGVWGDCAANGNISEYNPVADTSISSSNAYFGISTSISGNYAIVGAYLDDVGSNVDQGSASIYQYNGSNWVLMQKITDATGAAGDNFGRGVSISGNYAIVGAYADDVGVNTDQGSASIYQFNGSSWVLMQKITDASGAAGDYFGFSVSISGNNAIVGAYLDNVGANADQGSASIYQYNGSTWVQSAPIIDATGAANDQFGVSVSISGNYAIIGAFADDVGANTNQGSVSIFQFNGSFWVLMQKITDATGAANDFFGYSVCISGNYAIVGANGDDGPNIDQGSASIYQYNGSSWVLMQKMIDASGATSDNFGSSVSISGNYAIAGADRHATGTNTNQGSSVIYQRIGAGWKKLQYVIDPGGSINDHFGFCTGIDGGSKRFLIGAYGFTNNAGSAFFGKIN